MIVGIGSDLCRIERIEHSLRRFGDSFAETFCSKREIAFANAQHNCAATLALYFAAKEAFSKAVGTGFDSDMWWNDVEVVFEGDRSPHLMVSVDIVARLKVQFEASDGLKVHVSTSINAEYCSAFVIVERL